MEARQEDLLVGILGGVAVVAVQRGWISADQFTWIEAALTPCGRPRCVLQ
jgi:hypothetical protein